MRDPNPTPADAPSGPNPPYDDLKKLRRDLRVTRIFCAVSSLLTLLLLAFGSVFYLTVREIQAEAEPIVQQLSYLNIPEVNRALEQFNDTVENVNWPEISQSLEDFDVDAFNNVLQDLDTEELSKALKNLNTAIENLERLGETLGKLPSLF